MQMLQTNRSAGEPGPSALKRRAPLADPVPECRGRGRSGGWQCRALGGVRARSGYFERMARPGRSEDTSEGTSVPIWLKLSAVDSAKMDQVLARPEFEGWTKGEWCLEIIQTALRYYTKPRLAGEPDRRRAPVRPATAPASPPAEAVPAPAEPGAPEQPRAQRAPRLPGSVEPESPRSRRPSRLTLPQPPEPAPRRPEPPQAAQPEPPEGDKVQLDPGQANPGRLDAAEGDQVSELECSHPAEARDYQSGTCAACGAILWD
jgi:hypothetical protein